MKKTAMRALDLFSCIGCHTIGLGRAGIKTIGFCEINSWRRARLEEIYPEVPIHDDIRTFIGIQADIVIGGPPCQGTSVIAAVQGYRTGESLWPYMLRVGINVGAEWIIVEQPPGNAAWEAEVGNDLSHAGYHVARFVFGACDVGAPYIRRRVFLVACTSLARLEVAHSAIRPSIARVAREAIARCDWNPDKLATLQVDARSADEFDGGPKSKERRQWIEALGDSNPPHMAEVIGRMIMAAT